MRRWALLYVLLLFSPTILSHMLHYVYFSEIFNIYIWLHNPNFSNCLFAFDLSGFNVLHQLFATRFPFLDPLGWLGVLPSCSFFVFFFLMGARPWSITWDLHIQGNLPSTFMPILESDFLSLVDFASSPSCSECCCEKV